MQSQMVVRVLRMGALLAGAALATVPALGQEEVDYRSEVSVQAMGSFLEKTSSDRVTQSATDSGGVLASYRFFFNKYNGVELNYGYTLNTQSYEFPVSSISAKTNSISVKTNSDEATAAYIVRYPHRVAPFALVGTGAVVFDPTNFIKNPSGAGTQARAVFLYGAGSDFRLSDHLFLRAEYHGLVYPSPNFGLPELAGVARLTHRAEPSIGFGARF